MKRLGNSQDPIPLTRTGTFHGTSRAYEIDKCRCKTCRDWKSAKNLAYRQQQTNQPPIQLKAGTSHGTYSAYITQGCRCKVCRQYKSKKNRAYYKS